MQYCHLNLSPLNPSLILYKRALFLCVLQRKHTLISHKRPLFFFLLINTAGGTSNFCCSKMISANDSACIILVGKEEVHFKKSAPWKDSKLDYSSKQGRHLKKKKSCHFCFWDSRRECKCPCLFPVPVQQLLNSLLNINFLTSSCF